jgi:meso-butanediol dehydrogenase / (S,S)-butanediol dehydrogenase / diacetyl reductase
MRFSDKKVLVTGAASGIGAATAALFTKEGADVVAFDITPADGVLQLDVTDTPAVQAAVAEHGPFDIVLNVAGVCRLTHFADLTLQEWNRQLAINLTAPFVVSQAAMPGLVERKGNIVNVASIAGLRGQAYSAAYCASKAGVVMLTKSLALEFARRGVRVNCVAPGQVDTPLVTGVANQFPEKVNDRLIARNMNILPPGVSSPEDIADAIAYLASDAAKTVTGIALTVDGGIIS